LFGKEVLIETYPWFAVDQIVFSLPLSVIVIVVVSLVTGKKR
jgi:SSS family solute:Na+ symporter